jgi:LmbE family N-acetylglucosaminyl deacetylase
MDKSLVFNKKKKIVLSPHCDDFILSLGGTALKWGERKCLIEEWIIFSNSNYLVNDHDGNKDISKMRVKVVSSIRLKEEQNATKQTGNVNLRLLHQDEALIRGHKMKEHPRGFPHGFDKGKDEKVMKNIHKLLRPLFSKDVQIFVPLAIQEHSDHSIIKEVVANIIHNSKEKIKAQIFFYEDLPYAAYATKKEWKKVDNFIKRNKLLTLIIPISLNLKLGLLDFYNSQTDRSYYKGIINPATGLKNKKIPCERLYFLSRT